MALSFNELETQSVEFLPAREVMSAVGGNDAEYVGPSCNEYEGGILNGANLQDNLNFVIQIPIANIAAGRAGVAESESTQVNEVHEVTV